MSEPSTGHGPHEKPASLPFSLAPLLFLTSIFFLNFISRIILSPLMPVVEADLGFKHSDAGSLFLLISLGYFVALMGSGFISARFGHRKTIVLSSAVLGLTLLGISFAHSLFGFRCGALVLGMGAGIYLPSAIATITAMISSRQWGKALAIHELAPNLAFVAAPLLSEALLIWLSWRGVVVLLGISSLLVGWAFAWMGKGGDFRGQAPCFASFRVLLKEPAFWIMMVLFSMGISSTLGIYAMLPLYLVNEQGLDRTLANNLLALSRVSTLGMVFLGGWAADRFSPARTMGVVLLLTGILTVLLGIAPVSWIVLIVFLQPMLAVCFFPAGFAALSSIGPPETRNVAVSLTVPAAFLIGGGAIPTAIGFMGDAGDFSLGFVLVGVFIVLGALLSLCLKIHR